VHALGRHDPDLNGLARSLETAAGDHGGHKIMAKGSMELRLLVVHGFENTPGLSLRCLLHDERTGRIRTSMGSITQIPILTMPNDDITHPMPDLTGYITEGQIVLGRELFFAGIYPPVTVLPSLSRLMKDGIGKGRTRDDHPRWGAQLYAAYARTQDIRALASVIGEEELSETDQKYLKFGRAFEQEFVNQGFTENRSIERTLEIGWKLLSMLPKKELTRVNLDEIEKYYKGDDAAN